MVIETDAAHTPGGLANPAGSLKGPLAFAIARLFGLAYLASLVTYQVAKVLGAG